MNWRDDKDFQDEVIKSAKVIGGVGGHYVIDFVDGWSFLGIDVSMGRLPQPGETLRQFPGGIGRRVRGCVLDPNGDNPVVYYYRTPDEQEKRNKSESKRYKQEKREKFEKDRESMDARVAALPFVLRARIELFRANCPDFRWEYESYELFCCEEAVKISTALKSVAEVERFSKLSFQDQRAAIPALSGEHSGNTFGCAMQFASFLLREDRALPYLAHGALTPLVGCKDYGCVHPRPELPESPEGDGDRFGAVVEKVDMPELGRKL